MQSVIEQATHALQLGRFEAAKTLVSAALTAPDFSEQRLPFLEVLAQAQTALQEHAAAASSWQTAYQYTTTAEEKARIFEHARQALHEQQDYATLLPLAQAHLPHSRTPQEQAVCLLAAGEALAHLQRYHEARQDYLQPALDLVGIAPETRLYLWHYLGLSHLSEQRFTEAAAAFQQSADLALGQHFANAAAHQAAQRAQLHHLRNAARFYEGVIHLIYQRPQRAVQSFQELQRPFTTVGALNVALFLGLAYRTLLQPEAALRALQAPARTAGAPDTLRGPTAVVRAGIANLQETPAAVGDHLAAALEAALQPQTAWEPAWQALLYREMGLVLQRLSCRHAALLCYEEGVQAVVQRAGMWEDLEPSATPRGEQLLAALEALPLQDWSAVAQGELWQLLQGLAGIYGQTQTPAVVDRALALALRVTLTPEQALMVWCQRGWYLALSRTGAMTQEGATSLEAGLQEALARCPETPITEVAHGIEALLQGDPTSASATLAPPLALPNIPEWQALCTSSWLWAHTQRGTLEDALAPTVSLASLPWQSSPVLALALEMLLTSTPKPNATAPTLPCLAVLLAQHTAPTLEALRLLCRPGYLSSAHYTRLLAELRFLCNHCDQASVADQVAVLLGSTALMERIETLVAALDQRLSSSTPTPPQATRQRKQRQRRELTPAESLAADTAHIVQLVTLLQQTPQTVASNGPEAIFRWLRQYSQMTAQAPEVVGALLGFLRQCPGATAVIPALLEQVSLSRRQRQALEATLQTPTESSTTTVYGLSPWDDLRGWTLGRLFEALETCQQPGGTEHHTAFMARGQYLTALVLARVGLLSRAIATVQDCLQLQPGHPMAHYTLAQWRLAAGDQDAALDHTLQAWHGLQTLEAPPQVVQLELLNHLLRLLENTAQANRVPEWMATFGQARARLQEVPLTTAQQQQVHAEEGAFA
ncbi:MAG: hypothetical protein FJZ47_11700, partial [Candidatus Tectomicrobia bacterium]|nr:hypothetical protein [Candidatus Tectomicrobia bacterium]